MVPPFNSRFAFRAWWTRKVVEEAGCRAEWLARLDEIEHLAADENQATERLVDLLQTYRRAEDQHMQRKLDDEMRGFSHSVPAELTLYSQLAGLVEEALIWKGQSAREALIEAYEARATGSMERGWLVRTLANMGDPELDCFFGALRRGDLSLEQVQDPVALVQRTHTLARADRAFAVGGVEAVLAGMGHPDEAWRTWAAYAAGGMEDGRVVEPLRWLLADPSGAVRNAAKSALASIEGGISREPEEAPGQRLPRCLQREEDAVAMGAVDSEFDQILGALRHRSPLARWRAADALGAMGDSRAIGPLQARLQDAEECVRRAARAALARVEGTQA